MLLDFSRMPHSPRPVASAGGHRCPQVQDQAVTEHECCQVKLATVAYRHPCCWAPRPAWRLRAAPCPRPAAGAGGRPPPACPGSGGGWTGRLAGAAAGGGARALPRPRRHTPGSGCLKTSNQSIHWLVKRKYVEIAKIDFLFLHAI